MFEFDDAEDEIAGRDFVAKCFADLRDAKGNLDAHGVDDVFEIDENRLRRFRTQIGDIPLLPRFAHVGRKHQIEIARIGKILCCRIWGI